MTIPDYRNVELEKKQNMATKKKNTIRDMEVEGTCVVTISVKEMIEYLEDSGCKVYTPDDLVPVEGPIGAKTIGMLTAEAMVERIHNAEDQGQMHVLRDFLTSYLNISYTSDKDTILQTLSEML